VTCHSENALAARYRDDPDLFHLHRRKLLIRGWAGRLDDLERAYLRAHRPLTERQEEALRHARERSPLTRRPAEAPEHMAETALVCEVVPRSAAR
jgi:hypothetical protein